MFILGSVASVMLNNIKIGIVIFISHVLSSLLNGLLYKKIKLPKKIIIDKKQTQVNIIIKNKNKIKKEASFKKLPSKLKILNIKKNYIKQKPQTLNEIMLDTIISVLMIGGFIALSFTLLEIISNLKIFNFLSNSLCNIFPNTFKVISAFCSGILELTSGCLKLSMLNINIKILSILLSALVSFGGLSIHLQTNIFLQRSNIKYSYFLLTKITHTILSVLLSTILSLILL